MGATKTITAADFLGRIGVDTHIPYTDGGYANLSNVQADLSYLGVTELRDGISNGEYGSARLASYIQLAKAGAKFTFGVGGGASTTASVQSTLNTIGQLEAAVPGSIKAIEGPNEVNNQTLTFNGVGGLQGAVALQQYLYQTVKSTPALAGVTVDYFTGYNAGNIAVGPDPSTTSGLADYDTQHPYPQGGQAPAYWVDPSTALGNEPNAKGKFVYTETGYTTNLSDVNGVDATVQGKYTLDLLMDAAKDGSSGTYLYQLMDAYKPGSPQGDDGYGLFDENNNPKLAATGIHNLAAILADTGATASTFTPVALNYSVSGQPSTGNSLEISKSDGTTDIAVWAEPQLWNASTKSEIAAPTTIETVNLDAAHRVSVYDPLSGTAPIATYASTSSVQLQITDHPLIVQVEPVTTTGGTTNTDIGTVNAVSPSSLDQNSSNVDQIAPSPTSSNSSTIIAPSTSTIDTSVSVSALSMTRITAQSDPSSALSTPGSGQTAIEENAIPVGTAFLATTHPLANTITENLPAMATTTVHANGSSTVDLQSGDQTVSSNWHDTFLNHGMPSNTFVFEPGFERDVIRSFRVSGSDHDTVSLQKSDFNGSIAEILRNTTMVHGNAVIADPTTGDILQLTGVTKAQLVHNQRDFIFHP